MIDSEFLAQYKPRENSLSEKIIVITGAGDGIGRTLALACAKHGATIVLLGRTQAKLEAVYDEIESNGFPKPAIYPMNLEGAIEQDFSAMAEVLETEFGKIDGLIHNASELGPRTPLSNYSPTQWLKVMQVNVNAPFMMTKSLLPLLEKSESASILFTSSSVGHKGRAYWGAYAASKAAIENIVETLADELDGTSKVRVNSLNPGATRTGMRASAYPAEDPTTVPAPETIINRYLFLLGKESELINGQHFDAQP